MDIILGLGEIGLPWFNLVSKVREVVGVDLLAEKCKGEWSGETVGILHSCIPYSDNYVDIIVKHVLKYNPKMLIIHSTVKPFTTRKIGKDERLSSELQVLFSPIRGVHARMEFDLGRYDKFYASYHDDCNLFKRLLSDMGINGYQAKTPHTLEFAKILCDTTYFGFLITYAMKTEEIALKYDIDYNEMWMFADQIHQYLGNRPPVGSKGSNKLYADPEGIGGHCILPNIELVKEDLNEVYNLIHQINETNIKRHKK